MRSSISTTLLLALLALLPLVLAACGKGGGGY
jgi:predicted small lipoprotein YifL